MCCVARIQNKFVCFFDQTRKEKKKSFSPIPFQPKLTSSIFPLPRESCNDPVAVRSASPVTLMCALGPSWSRLHSRPTPTESLAHARHAQTTSGAEIAYTRVPPVSGPWPSSFLRLHTTAAASFVVGMAAGKATMATVFNMVGRTLEHL